MAKLKWQSMCEHEHDLERMAVPGGWLVRTSASSLSEAGVGICFYPDPNHLWE